MKLLTTNQGWAATDERIFWTNNGGAIWKDITPHLEHQERIADVFFLDTLYGWVLFSKWDEESDRARYDLAMTGDSGETWAVNSLKMPGSLDDAAPGGQIEFLDLRHGYMNVPLTGSSNYRPGVLLETRDGGTKWHLIKSPTYPGIAAQIRFITAERGWLAGGPGNEFLYVTDDGARNWRQLSLEAPAAAHPAVYPVYDIPVFRDDKHGYLAVTYSAPGIDTSTLVVFTSADKGSSWKPGLVLTSAGPAFTGLPVPTAFVDAILVTAKQLEAPESIRVSRTKIVSKGENIEQGASSFFGSAVSRLSFIDRNHGWVLANGRLMSINNLGNTPRDITPGGTQPHEFPSDKSADGSRAFVPSFSGNASDAIQSATLVERKSVHLGIDMCQATTAANMQTWWNSSPYNDYGIYIGGSNRTCKQPNLSSSWVTAVTSSSAPFDQGWGLLPLWAGPAAPCSSKNNKINQDPTQAAADGITEANAAVAAAQNLGLSGTVLYYDMERYTPSAPLSNNLPCGAAVNAFLSSWDSQVTANGYAAGIYGNPIDAATWYLGSSSYNAVLPLPQNVWMAGYDNRATIWGLGLKYGFLDSMWSQDQRIHQYRGTHNEMWPPVGGLTLSVDNDIENATVAGDGTNISRTYVFDPTTSFQSIDCGSGTSAIGINDQGQVVGTYLDTKGYEHGFIYNGTCSIIPDPTGAIASYPTGINNKGLITGHYESTTGLSVGFIYNPAATYPYTTIKCLGAPQGTVPRKINDDRQVFGTYYDINGGNHGFIYANKQCTSIDLYTGGTTLFDGNGDTFLLGANASTEQWFLYDEPSNATPIPILLTPLDSPSINNSLQIAGDYQDTTGVHGFLYDFTLGTFLAAPINYPNAIATSVYGVNDGAIGLGKLQIVGQYYDSSGQGHGFIATAK